MSYRTAFLAGSVLAFAFIVCQEPCQAQEKDKGLAPWASNTHPTDVAKSRVEEIKNGKHEYTVTQGGTMDGLSTRIPPGIWQPWTQTWESNRLVRIENVGDTDVVNPWLSNGRNNFRTMEEIVQAALLPGMTDRDKAMAIWFQEITHRFHFSAGGEVDNIPVLVFNVLGYNTCGDDSQCLAGLWKTAGLKQVRPARVLAHCISQVFYDGRWHMLDGDQQSIYLLRDNHTIASEHDIVMDHDLIKRTPTRGFLSRDSRAGDEDQASLYFYEGDEPDDRNVKYDFNMNMTLRPGEALVYRWGHLEPVKYYGSPVKYKDTVANGLWEYRPDLTKAAWRTGAQTAENIQQTRDGLVPEAGKIGVIIWKIASPYTMVGGRVEPEGNGAKFSVSWDQKTWDEMPDLTIDASVRKGTYRGHWVCYLKCELPEGATLKKMTFSADVQMAPLAMPEMVVGQNKFVYTDETKGPRKVRITHEWGERSATKPPAAPAKAVFPSDGGQTDGTEFAFQWALAEDPDGDQIADYHFELSERSDMRWPLSPNFYKLISLTADKDRAQYTLPYPELLTPGTTYYWHVRAKDSSGVWGPWSKTWSFTAQGPTHPVDVTLSFDEKTGVGTLSWKSNSIGRRPAKYRVYGSDERGFSVSDTPYKVFVGKTPNLSGDFPANFVAETDKTELVVVAQGLNLPNANRAFYRVVALDEKGNRSWSSAYAEAPRPFITTQPVDKATVGKAYTYAPGVIRSIGDLRRRAGKEGGSAFWDIERPVFNLEKAPDWLKLDPETGTLNGTPDAAGKFEVVLSVTLQREERLLDSAALAWGNEKVKDTKVKTLGPVTQKFTIDVGK